MKYNKINLKTLDSMRFLPFVFIIPYGHSHASLLIEMGYNILLVSERLGHEKVETTLNTYAHLYPNKQQKLVEGLQNLKIEPQ